MTPMLPGIAALVLGAAAGVLYALSGGKRTSLTTGLVGALAGAAVVLVIVYVQSSAKPREEEHPRAAAPSASSDRGGRTLHGTITLAPKTEVKPGTTLFLIARTEHQLRGQPIAVKRVEATTFPMRFELTDDDSMTGKPLPERALIQVRADADGDPMTHGPDDASGSRDSVEVGKEEVRIELVRESVRS